MLKNSPEEFGEEYYRTGNYADYLERGPRYHQIAIEMDQLFQMLNLCDKNDSVLDYGCGAGFLCESLIKLGYEDVWGCEKSEWAMAELKRKGIPLSDYGSPVTMIALDVFEHMEDIQIHGVLSQRVPQNVICRMPIAKEGQNEFSLEISRKDKTHINCKTKTAWIQFFKDLGFKTVLRLNMRTIYDSEGVACLLAIRT